MTKGSNGRVLMITVLIVLVVSIGGYFLAMAPSTAPTTPPDRAGTEERLPAAPADPRTQTTTGSADPAKP